LHLTQPLNEPLSERLTERLTELSTGDQLASVPSPLSKEVE
jgi:hypothetical protein